MISQRKGSLHGRFSPRYRHADQWRVKRKPKSRTLLSSPERNRRPVGNYSGALIARNCRSPGARLICQLARAFCLKSRESIGFRKLSLHSAVAAGVLAVTAGWMVPASGESRDTKSPDPAVASNDPYYFFANPFALASQPRLKQSVFGFAGRTNSGNLGSTFAFGSGAPETIFFDNYIIRRGVSAGPYSVQQRSAHWRRSWLCGSIRQLFSLLRQGGPFKSRRAFSGVMGRDFLSTRRPRLVRYDPDFTRICVWIECDIKSNRSGSVAPGRSSRQREGAFLPGL